MKLWKWVLLGTLLAVVFAGGASTLMASAPAADSPVTITVYNPTGASEVTQLFAPRLADLNGKTVCELSLGIWEADRTYALITDALQKQYSAKVVPWDKLPALSETKDVPGIEDAVKKAGCQGILVGNAG
jgi:hypothetical protein